jgi:fascin 1/2
VNIRSIGRKRFAVLASPDLDEIHVEANVPWGEHTLFTLEFREEANKYAVHTANDTYLQKDGKLVPEANKVGQSIRLSALQARELSQGTEG